jgi:multiple sugar transport system permease protein
MRKSIPLIAVVSLIVLWSLLPIYWSLRTSLLPEIELTTTPLKYIPMPLSLENYQNLLGIGTRGNDVWIPLKNSLINSIVTSTGTTLLVLLLSVLAGYAFSRFTFKGKNLLIGTVLVTIALPAYSVMIPLYRIIIRLGLLDTWVGIILIFTSAFAPLGVWLMKVAFDTIPIELEEAAMVDGASPAKTLLTILPLAVPGMVAVATLTFLSAWSQFVIPLVFSPQNASPITVLITQFVGRTSIDYGLMSAAGIIAIIPPLLVVIFLSKYLVDGLMRGAIKN